MGTSKKQKQYEAILAAALKLFTRKGYFNASISDIQKASKMSVGSFYNYFENKDESFG